MERDYFCESYSICCVCKKRIYGIPRSFPNGAGLYCNNCFANKQAEFDFKPIKISTDMFQASILQDDFKTSCEFQLAQDIEKRIRLDERIKVCEKLKAEFNSRKLEYISTTTGSHCYGLRIDRINEILEELEKVVEDESNND